MNPLEAFIVAVLAVFAVALFVCAVAAAFSVV
jgi:hypothetical protein